ncbi:MAG: serine/threonine protein kinase/tetratricopeptide (TPR) repeat protein [Myxococcota bacterium]|jgi:serine/threonine protein kinase/tetratricopeptide (TPR) repeat protein
MRARGAKTEVRLTAPVPLGTFLLHARIGVGGSGEVWQGVHAVQRLPVAVKVITADRARDPRYLEAFAREVRAVAGLDHPGVVRVFESGRVDVAAEVASAGRLVAGSPFLAMQLAESGSLRTLRLPRTWVQLQSWLLWLLEALGHAHSHGVVHRDLKPGNVLVLRDPALPDDPLGATRLCLSDFGLAHAAREGERLVRGTSGTPIFMAPEQFKGHWREFGPPTDLYAFGCLAWALSAGRAPYRGKGLSALMQAHLSAPLPAVVPRFDVPADFESWVHRLIQKDPDQRFQRAADASWALRHLGRPVPQPSRPVQVLEDLPEHDDRSEETTLSEVTLSRTFPEMRSPRVVEAIVPVDDALPRLLPPQPIGWLDPHERRPSIRLVGAGLGLYGLRRIPLVGREAERDVLWETIRQARTHADTRCCVIQGAAGTGKSRLAEWVAQRADAVGSALVLRVTHSPGSGGPDGMAAAISRAMGCVGLDRDALAQRVERWYRRRGHTDPFDWEGLLSLMWPRADAGEDIRFLGADERHAVLDRWLATWSGHQDDSGAHRQVLIWLDDAQWGPDALGLLRWLLVRPAEVPRAITVIATVQEEALSERPAEAFALDNLLGHPNTLRLRLGPLDRSEQAELVQKLLLLDADLAALVEERCAGNPLFAVQLVGDWVQRGVLAVRDTGFVLREGATAVLPDDLHALWKARVGDAVDDLGPEARPALELGALLGLDVSLDEWRGACRVAQVRPPDDLIDVLLARRLARRHDGGWSFAHGMLRESLERSAQESGRWAQLHQACATVLQIRYDATRRPRLAGRLGRHLYHAGEPELALDFLGIGARERRAMSDYTSALALLDLRDRVLRSLGVNDDDVRWGQDQVQRAGLLVGLGRLDDASRLARRVVTASRRHGWGSLLAPSLRAAASAAAKQGRLEEAESLLRDAEESARGGTDERELSRSLLFLSDVTRMQGRYHEAIRCGKRSYARFAVLEDRRGQADALTGLAAACLALGDLVRTERYARQAIPLYEAVNGRFGMASLQNTLGDVLRARGALAEATEAYLTAELSLRRLGSPERLIPLFNLGLVLLAQGRYVEARESLEPCREAMARAGRRGLEGALNAALLCCDAAESDWGAWDQHAARAELLLGASGFVDGDIAAVAEQAADLAVAAGQGQRGLSAARLAAAQWLAVGKLDRAEAVEERMETSHD